MSTSAVVSVGSPESWRGVYVHSDGYPNVLGREIWGEFASKGVSHVVEGILGSGSWAEYLSSGICGYCGKKAGRPHTISSQIVTKEDLQQSPYKNANGPESIAKYLLAFGWSLGKAIDSATQSWEMLIKVRSGHYSDPEARYHKHSENSRPKSKEHFDPMWVEWVYIIDTSAGALHILTSHKNKETSDFDWQLLTSVNLSGVEPDWTLIHEAARNLPIEGETRSDYEI